MTIALVLAACTVVFGLLLTYFSPYQICFEYQKRIGIEQNLGVADAEDYATRLCNSKFPFRD
ncbi:MAG: hypothetical protein AAGF74_12120 [Pseudomonadota bacterium]